MNFQASGNIVAGVLTGCNLYAPFSAHSTNHPLIRTSIVVTKCLMLALDVSVEVDARYSRHASLIVTLIF